MRGMGIIASGENPHSRLEDIVLQPALKKGHLLGHSLTAGKVRFL
jgi:hypothetical protein